MQLPRYCVINQLHKDKGGERGRVLRLHFQNAMYVNLFFHVFGMRSVLQCFGCQIAGVF